MNVAVATVVAAVVGVIGVTVGAIVSAWLNKDRDDADTAEKISAAWDPVFKRYDADMERISRECAKCEEKLTVTEERLRRSEERQRIAEERMHRSDERERKMQAALRAIVRVMDENDPTHVRHAIEVARDLL